MSGVLCVPHLWHGNHSMKGFHHTDRRNNSKNGLNVLTYLSIVIKWTWKNANPCFNIVYFQPGCERESRQVCESSSSSAWWWSWRAEVPEHTWFTASGLNKHSIIIKSRIKTKSMTSQGYSRDLDWRHIWGLVLVIRLLQGGDTLILTTWLCSLRYNTKQYCEPPLVNGAFSHHLIKDNIYFSLRSQWRVLSYCVQCCGPHSSKEETGFPMVTEEESCI